MEQLWTALDGHRDRLEGTRILDLFANPERAVQFSAEADGLHFDYSKTGIDSAAMDALLALADTAGVAQARDAMLSGAKINTTEDRAVLHTALRRRDGVVTVDGRDVMPGVRDTHDRMSAFAEAVRDGRFRVPGGTVTDVVNIGIGGSDLGPAMAALALSPYADGPRVHFVSNVDGAQIAETLRDLDPATTLVIVASKTFTTIETMTNAETARRWMAAHVDDPAAQFVALSSAQDRAAEFGIPAERVFGFEDWVGGRYSVWGPIGLALMLAIGPADFRAFLDGGAAMDRNFETAPFDRNLPVLLALVGIWHHQVCGHATRAVLPYDQRLARLPAYLQQLEMESNGKRVTRDGKALTRTAGPVVWGEPGTNGQHAFYQLIHQGRQVVPCEFLVAARGHEPDLDHQHVLLLSNCLAQAEALMRGRTLDEAKAKLAGTGLSGEALDAAAMHRVFPGNRPSTLLLYRELTPFVLGQIVALYEHRVFVEGVILGINSFDQWGVELGKELAKAMQPLIEGTTGTAGKDGSTAALVARVRSLRGA